MKKVRIYLMFPIISLLSIGVCGLFSACEDDDNDGTTYLKGIGSVTDIGEYREIVLEERGVLGDLIELRGLEKVSAIKISGTIDGNDIETLREVLLSDAYNIKSIDISEVVYGGDGYRISCQTEHRGWLGVSGTLYPTYLPSAMFACCDRIEEIVLPDGLENIGFYAFYECTSLQKVTISTPESVIVIEDYAYAYCNNLREVMQSKELFMLEGAFYNCESLQEIKLYSGWLYSIYEQTFANCLSLQEITIPSGVDRIREGAFYSCTSMNPVYCYATTPPSLDSLSFGLVDAYLYVPQGCREAYEESDWNNYFAGRIYEME